MRHGYMAFPFIVFMFLFCEMGGSTREDFYCFLDAQDTFDEYYEDTDHYALIDLIYGSVIFELDRSIVCTFVIDSLPDTLPFNIDVPASMPQYSWEIDFLDTLIL